MRTTRIELEGRAGRVEISAQRNGTIFIASISNKPPKGQEVMQTWDLPTSIDAAALFEVAEQVQQRCDGCRGTNSMIHDYYRELQRFAD